MIDGRIPAVPTGQALTADVAAAYSATGKAWRAGPGRVYDRLAEALVARCPGGVRGGRVLDLGAGDGAATRAAARAGAAAVVALDAAVGMLSGAVAADRMLAGGVAADARSLPFADGAFGAVVAAFSLNHLEDPAAGLREGARVLAGGGGLVVSAYADDDAHPAKAAVESACADAGWESPAWYSTLRRSAMPRLATPERAAAAAATAGLAGAAVARLDIAVPDLDAGDLVDWRLGMAHVAPFLARLPSDPARAAVRADAIERLGPEPPPLVRRVVVLTWRRPAV